MGNKQMLKIASLLAIVLLTFHMADDILISGPRGFTNLTAIAILAVYLVGTLLLSERRSGYVIMLLGGIIALGMPVLHFWYGIGKARGFVFVAGLLALGIIGIFNVILAVLELRGVRRTP